MKRKTMTVFELMIFLNELNKQGLIKSDTKVYLSSDEEGNSFGTIVKDSFQVFDDNKLVFFPFQERLQLEDI